MLVSHDLELVYDVADEIQVMRLGRVQGVRRRADTDRSEIVGLITGAIRADQSRRHALGCRGVSASLRSPPAGRITPDARSNVRRREAPRPILRIVTSPQILLVVVIAVFVVFGATQSDQFLASGTWINILRNAVFIAIIGCFTTFVFVVRRPGSLRRSVFRWRAHGDRRWLSPDGRSCRRSRRTGRGRGSPG